jgi:CubicO group peptidase (beta-lactamase class C family)
MKKYKTLFSLIITCASIILKAQDSTTIKIDNLLSQYNRPNSPGLAMIVIEKGTVIYKKSYGLADLEHNIPITPKTVFEIGSLSKHFTAFCALQLAEKGLISLDDDIRKYIPELKNYGNIKIINLITHTSGLRDYNTLLILSGLNWDNNYSDEMLMDLIIKQKQLNFKPGDEYSYSNTGYFILKEIIERVSGKSLRQFADSSIFKPLGMASTHFHDDYTELVPNRALGYSKQSAETYNLNISFSTIVGPGRLYTNVEDLYKWDQNFYNNKLGGGQKLIEQSIKTFTLNNQQISGYACGLGVNEYKNLKTISHLGLWAGYTSGLLRFPDKQISIICLSNSPLEISPKSLNKKVADIFFPYQNTSQEKINGTPPIVVAFIPVKKDSIFFKKIVGKYYSEELNTYYQFFIKDNKLFVKWRDFKIAEVEVGGDKELRVNNMCLLHLSENSKKEIIGFKLDENNVKDIDFVKVNDK